MKKHRKCTHMLPYIINQPSATVTISQHTSRSPLIYAHTVFPNFGTVISTEKLSTCLENYHMTNTVSMVDFIAVVRFMQGGDTSFAHWTLGKADSPDSHKHLIIKTKGFF